MDALARDIGDSDSVRSIGRIRRFWWLVLLGALLGLVAGSAAVALIQKQYTSTTTVFVYAPADQTQVTGARTNSSVNMDNELQFLSSVWSSRPPRTCSDRHRLRRAREEPHRDRPGQHLGHRRARTRPAARSRPSQYSHAFAQAYLQVRKDQAVKSVAAQTESLNAQYKALQAAGLQVQR